MPHHRAKDTKREKDAVQLHSARNKTKLTAPAAAQCTGQKQGITERKVRERGGERKPQSATKRTSGRRDVLSYALTPKLECSFIASVLQTG